MRAPQIRASGFKSSFLIPSLPQSSDVTTSTHSPFFHHYSTQSELRSFNMSDNESTQEKTEQKVTFTEKEEMVLKLAWRCLKSGPPEVQQSRRRLVYLACADNSRSTSRSLPGSPASTPTRLPPTLGESSKRSSSPAWKEELPCLVSPPS